MNFLGINGADFIFLSSRRPEEVDLGYSSAGLLPPGRWGVGIFVHPPPPPAHQGSFGASGDIFSYHDRQRVGGQCYWHPVGGSQSCCHARDSPTKNHQVAPNINSARLRDPELEEV